MDVLELLGKIDPGVAVNLLVFAILAGAFVKWVWPILRRLVLAAEKLERVEKDVAAIKTEVTYNNGTSLKDAVRRVEQGQASQDAQLERLQLAVFHNGPTA